MIEYNTTTKHKVALLRGLYRGRNPSQLQFLLGGLLPSADCSPFSSVSLSLEPFSSVSGPRAPFHWRIASAAALAGQAHGQLCPFRHALYLVDVLEPLLMNGSMQSGSITHLGGLVTFMHL